MEFSFSDPVKVDAPADYELLPYSSCEKSVGEVFREIAGKFPNHIALVDSDHQVTYLELNRKVNQVTHALLRLDLTSPAVVAFLLDRDIEAIAVILAILKAGFIYMALDPQNPTETIQTILEDAKPSLVITNGRFLSQAKAYAQDRIPILNLDELAASLPDGEPGIKVSDDQLAAIFYTSGTAGQPKGVVLDHRALIHRTWVHLNLHHLSPQDRSPLPFPFSFAWSITPLFSSLLSGGTGYPCDYGRMQLNELADWVDQKQLTILHMSPSLLRQLLASLPEGRRFKNLRLMNVGSEALFPNDLAAWKKHATPGDILAYGLASSEMGTITRKFFNHQYEPTSNRLPVGYPVPSVSLMILGEDGRPVVGNEVGEVAIQSWSAIRGYWNKAETAKLLAHRNEGFHPTGDLGRLLPEGALEYHGRLDTMVKIRGYRVDTTEIALIMGNHPAIKESFVAARSLPHAPKNKQIVAYVVLKENQSLSSMDLRQFLRSHLPAYKLPARFVFMDKLPRTSHEKVDLNSLPQPSAKIEGTSPPPGSSEEKLIARIWCDILGLDSIGLEENFFDWGGDSLSALTMAMEIEKQVGKPVPRVFFERATIAHLLHLWNQNEPESKGARPTPRTTTRRAKGTSMDMMEENKNKQAMRFPLERLVSKGFWLERAINITPLIYRSTMINHSFRDGIAWLQDWCHHPHVAHGIYQLKYELFCQMIASLDGCKVDPETAFPANLAGNILMGITRDFLENSPLTLIEKIANSRLPFWKDLLSLIRVAPLADLNKYYTVTGLTNLEHAQKAGRGVVILTYHSTINNLAVAALPRQANCGAIQTVSRRNAIQKDSAWQDTRPKDIPLSTRYALSAREALMGQNLLKQGRVVQLVGDGDAGTSVGLRTVAIAGRRYQLFPGFAELALNTGAAILPHYTTLLQDGRIHTTILPQLIVLQGSREAQVADLVDQYALFMSNSWKVAPESLRWKKMERHLKNPLLQEAK